MKIEHTVKRLEKSNVELTVTVAQEDVEKDYKACLSEYAKKVQIHGFRVGHVPEDVLLRKYKEDIDGAVASRIINEALNDLMNNVLEEEDRLLPYSKIVPKESVKLDRSKDFTFSVIYDVFPKIELDKNEFKDYSDIEITIPTTKITDEIINRELKSLRARNAVVRTKDSDTLEMNDIATINCVELDENGAAKEDTRREEFIFTLGSGENLYYFDEDIVGMKKGETKEFSKTYPENFSIGGLAGDTVKFKVELLEIKIRELPELDDEFAQDVDEKYKTMEDLKEGIRSDLQDAIDSKTIDNKVEALLLTLLEKYDFVIPDTMLDFEKKHQFKIMARERFNMEPAQLEELLRSDHGEMFRTAFEGFDEYCSREIKSEILVSAIGKKCKAVPNQEDKDEVLKVLANNSGISLEEAKVRFVDSDSDLYKDGLENRTTVRQLLESVKITEGKEVDLYDFIGLM